MITSLLWLFKAYRDLVFENQLLKRTIEDLHVQLTRNPSQSTMDMIRHYQEDVLTEQPFPDGKIPENLWLTPETR